MKFHQILSVVLSDVIWLLGMIRNHRNVKEILGKLVAWYHQIQTHLHTPYSYIYRIYIWPLCGEFTGDRWIPRTNGQLRGKCFHLMTLSCENIKRALSYMMCVGFHYSAPIVIIIPIHVVSPWRTLITWRDFPVQCTKPRHVDNW